MEALRIGAVSYLNTKPLVYGMSGASPSNILTRRVNLDPSSDAQLHPVELVDAFSNGQDRESLRFELSFDLPSRLADKLAHGEIDVALIPSIEMLDHPGYVVVSDACIACRGPVWSVKFLSRKPLEAIQTVALDEGSRTSAVLTKIMLNELGVNPTYRQLDIDADWRQVDTDAVLIIGDRAMDIEPVDRPSGWIEARTTLHQEFPIIYDMGDWWYRSTGFPFVFAVWTASPNVTTQQLNGLTMLLNQSRDSGLNALRQLANWNGPKYGLTEQRCLEYFKDNLHFFLGEREKQALDLFFLKAEQAGLLTYERADRFHDCQTS